MYIVRFCKRFRDCKLKIRRVNKCYRVTFTPVHARVYNIYSGGVKLTSSGVNAEITRNFV